MYHYLFILTHILRYQLYNKTKNLILDEVLQINSNTSLRILIQPENSLKRQTHHFILKTTADLPFIIVKDVYLEDCILSFKTYP